MTIEYFVSVGLSGRHLITSPPVTCLTTFLPSGVRVKSAQYLLGEIVVRFQYLAVAPWTMPSLFTMMFAPTAGVASYLAWIIESAWACVSSGADLQPAKTIPAPKIAKDIKTFIFATFFTFPPLDTHDWLIYFDPPFLSYFPLLSMELEVTGRTTDRLILWKSPGQPKIEAKLPPSFTAPPVSVPSPRQSGPREIQEIPSRPSAGRPGRWEPPPQIGR